MVFFILSPFTGQQTEAGRQSGFRGALMPDDVVVSMETPPDIALARALTLAAEALAVRQGLGRRENLRFQLTVEEFFCCLVQIADAAHPIHTVLTGKRHLMRVSFGFAASTLSLGALNATAVTTIDADSELPRDMGLLLAAKVADRFHLAHKDQTNFVLEAEVDKVYPPAPLCSPTPAFRPPYRAAPCRDPGQLTHAAGLAAAAYPAWNCPVALLTPGKFADMVEDGDASDVVAFDAAGQVAGLLCWSPSGAKGLHFSGPFVFTPPADAGLVARLLTDRFLEVVARQGRDIVFSPHATPDTPPGYFESLGSLELVRQDGRFQQDVLYRHLREDAGTAVWSHAALTDFLRTAYDRLSMCRDILPAEPPEVRESRPSLLSANLDRGKNLAELRPLLDGKDMPENLAGHVQALEAKGFGNILFYMNLSQAWEAALAGDLLSAGFVPRLVLPHGGRGDVAVFQYAPAY
jgi:hypothetical protein